MSGSAIPEEQHFVEISELVREEGKKLLPLENLGSIQPFLNAFTSGLHQMSYAG